jgi:peroxiredoxin
MLTIASLPNAHCITVDRCSYMGDIILKDISGETFQLKEYKGKIIFVTFWSTWCMRCKKELMYLHENFGNKRDVAIITVNQDSDKKINEIKVKEFIDEIGAHELRVAVDRSYKLWDRFGLNALPSTIIIDSEGRVAYAESNFHIDSPEIIEKEFNKLQTDNYCSN